MSQENVKIASGVRTPLVVSAANTRRTLDEWIFVWFPALYRAVALGMSRLPPSSRLRRVLISRSVRQAYEAANRRDFDVLLVHMGPEFEMRFDESPGGFVPPDLLGVHSGHEQYLRVWEAAIEAFDLKLELEEIIDFGDRLLLCGGQTGHGTASGVPVNQPLFQIITLRRGLVIRQEDFMNRGSALEAARLSE